MLSPAVVDKPPDLGGVQIIGSLAEFVQFPAGKSPELPCKPLLKRHPESLFPAVDQLANLASKLGKELCDLGLERKAREVSLHEYLGSRTTDQEGTGHLDAVNRSRQPIRGK